MRTLMTLLAIAGTVLGAGLRNPDGKPLIPVAKLRCLPLYEVKDIAATRCRVGNTDEHALHVVITFLHRASGPANVTVTCDMAPGGSLLLGAGNTHTDTVLGVKPNVPTRVTFLYEKYHYPGTDALNWRPVISFSHTPFPVKE